MDPVYATAAYCRATLITPHDYLRTVGNLKTVEGSTVAGISNQGRQSGLRRSRNQECREARSVTLAHLPRSRWTHEHRRFAYLSVVHRNSSSTSRIILIYITGSSSSTSRRHRRSSSTSRLSRGVFNIATIPSTSENQRAAGARGQEKPASEKPEPKKPEPTPDDETHGDRHGHTSRSLEVNQ